MAVSFTWKLDSDSRGDHNIVSESSRETDDGEFGLRCSLMVFWDPVSLLVVKGQMTIQAFKHGLISVDVYINRTRRTAASVPFESSRPEIGEEGKVTFFTPCEDQTRIRRGSVPSAAHHSEVKRCKTTGKKHPTKNKNRNCSCCPANRKKQRKWRQTGGVLH